ncbi:uncharacterized protein F4807DRAFT_461516 [Annulohypoxylon truncatum]|uniref:uncharacterized protein n=1 Tax=Annulohypoxylon truncatum TaxID=327061 RepID=UPI002007BED9|nr:uncharacterized protein F4807DRAFT_461516 [Annulohypoxylon truncatum]KAI1208579.1 hypothetical protein F4807DRAFT_461516 [Annulohypoxylon truncatum]
MQAQGFQDPASAGYLVSPLELEKPNVEGISDMPAPAPHQLLTPAASFTEEFPNELNGSDSDMVYNSQGQRSLDPTPLTHSEPSTSQSQTKTKRERNRRAAHKCRQKSKANIEQLKQREQELSQRNKDLKDTAFGLRNEVLCLKNEVLMHGTTCDNGPIQNYLSRVVDDLVDRNPS